MDVRTNEEPTDVVQQCFRILLTESLRATPDDLILLLHDEELDEFLDDICQVASELDLSITAINLRRSYQRSLVRQMAQQGDDFSLPELTKTALSNATVILSLLNGDQETVPLRRSIIRQPTRYRGCRLAHIPGLTHDIMKLVLKTDFAQITSDCELIAWFLGWGRDAQLKTTDQSGRSHVLQMDLGGWSNEPLMSPGIIPPGSWGNFPPGEAFCCPDPRSVNGSICINGSIPGFRIEGSEEITLSFEQGRLVHWDSATGRTNVVDFFEKQASSESHTGDANWRFFCELGIGLNSCIKTLTGNSLFDEKAANSVHIAIGDNTPFGHGITASMHADMVTWNPTLTVSGREILKTGVLQRAELSRFRYNWTPPPLPLNENDPLKLRYAKFECVEGRLLRRLSSGDRVSSIDMASPIISRALAELSEKLRDCEGVRLTRFVSDYPAFGGIPTRELLSYLYDYGCMFEPRDVEAEEEVG